MKTKRLNQHLRRGKNLKGKLGKKKKNLDSHQFSVQKA